MEPDIFGNLREWGKVIDKLEKLKSEHHLDNHQVGLARIVRYNQNWRLRDTALECATLIDSASDILIAEALNILVSQDVPIHTRMLAARALEHLIPHRSAQTDSNFNLDYVIKSMGHVLSNSGSPVLHKTLREALIGISMKK